MSWARFYDLKTGKPVFPGRDGVLYDTFEAMAAQEQTRLRLLLHAAGQPLEQRPEEVAQAAGAAAETVKLVNANGPTLTLGHRRVARERLQNPPLHRTRPRCLIIEVRPTGAGR